MSVRTTIRGLVRGVTWKNPVVNVFVHLVDPVDSIARHMGGRSALPPYSIRVRSAGIRNDIGGKEFIQIGQRMSQLLRAHAALAPTCNILEIGCGCGRNAFALAEYLNHGNYTGMDIEKVSLKGARDNSLLRSRSFRFDLLDVRNDAYNPDGRYSATEYVLPYANETFDVVFMISVFTHMLTGEVQNYATQIARVLKPGGRCFFTAFLLDGRNEKEFPFRAEQHSYSNKSIPEIAVGYSLDFVSSTFAANGMRLTADPIRGAVTADALKTREQDAVVFTK